MIPVSWSYPAWCTFNYS